MPKVPYRLGPGVTAAAQVTPYCREPGDPVHRPLRVYTQDPGTSQFDGAIATLPVTWEPAGPGPSGRLFVVRDVHGPTGSVFAPVDLDDRDVLLGQGLTPSTTNPAFAQQMTYAVAMTSYDRFRLALGRLPEFAPAVRNRGDGRLEIRPHFDLEDNAYYVPGEGALCFGYVKATASSAGRTQKGAFVFTSLSHDVIAHEVAHAFLDGMRPHLFLPSNPDVAAFHEGFADLVALLMRFRYTDVVRRGLEDSERGRLDSRLLTEMAREWGRSDGDGRSALRQVRFHPGQPDDPIDEEYLYDRDKEHHDLGAVLVAAVFEAMSRVFDKKTRTLRKIGEQAPGARDHLIGLLTREASDLAGQFLNIIIRAIDYCPPVDLTFGEFLRALVTADFVTVPEDPYGYREALVLAFRRYGITVPAVPDLSEEALLWRAPEVTLPPLARLGFARLRHDREPGWFPGPVERARRARALGDYITAGRHKYFGVVPPGRRDGAEYEPPVIESVRTLRRLSPDNELDFHVVAEVTQRVRRNRRWFPGGSTVVIDECGRIRYVIGKGVGNQARRQATDRFLAAAPPEYRQAFEADTWDTGRLVRRFHARGQRRPAARRPTATARTAKPGRES
ncbi:MAG TPA: hypothetical protein VMM93_09075 [Vicinamibacterales bacterium]|nr:hypothetical protein [Vicinamibacterales bacterium]